MTSLQGKLLLASPAMEDPNFGRAVILLVEHGEHGALGLVLNKPTVVSARDVLPEGLRELLDGFSGEEQVLRHGGPCRGPLMVLHRRSESSQVEVLPGMHFATREELVASVLREVSELEGEASERVGRRLLFFAGYAGWGPGQLEEELSSDAWWLLAGDASRVFEVDGGTWMRGVRELSQAALRRTLPPTIVPPDASVN